MATHSTYLASLSAETRDKLILELWERQNHKCFVTGKEIDLDLHMNQLDIDHVIALNKGGADTPSNLALEFSDANRSKGDKDLNYARCIWQYYNLENQLRKENKIPNLEDVLHLYNGAKYELEYKIKDNFVTFSFTQLGNKDLIKTPVYTDTLSKQKYFFAEFPIEYLFHDEKINPRKLNSSLTKLMSEFYNGYPQLHIALGYITGTEKSKVMIFDGQHKTSAQILLNTRKIPVRVFINPDEKLLTDSNLHAGTTLKQVAFDKSVISGLGSKIYRQFIEEYQLKNNTTDFNFSEQDLIRFFIGEKSIKKYIIDDIKTCISNSPDNKLMDFVEFGGRSTEKPLSYSSIDKTFYSIFINTTPLSTSLNYLKDDGKNPRDLEKQQIIRLMNLIADKILLNNNYDMEIGTAKIEYKINTSITDGTPLNISWNHIRACRMLDEVCLKSWLMIINSFLRNYIFLVEGIEPTAIFQTEINEQGWVHIDGILERLINLPLWKNAELTRTVFGAKQNDAFWNSIFSRGTTPDGFRILAEPFRTSLK